MESLAEHVLSLRTQGFRIHLASNSSKERPTAILVEDLEERTDASGRRLLKVLAEAFKNAGLHPHLVFRPYSENERSNLNRSPRDVESVKGRVSVFTSESLTHFPDEDEQGRIRELHGLLKQRLRSR